FLWLGGISTFLPLFGLSPREDVVERRNHPAAWAISGALVGLTLCFAGAVGSADPAEEMLSEVPRGLLATLALLLLWAILERLASPSEAITVERDGGAAWRLAGVLIALGLLLGQAFADGTANPGPVRSVLEFAAPLALLLVATGVEFAVRRCLD